MFSDSIKFFYPDLPPIYPPTRNRYRFRIRQAGPSATRRYSRLKICATVSGAHEPATTACQRLGVLSQWIGTAFSIAVVFSGSLDSETEGRFKSGGGPPHSTTLARVRKRMSRSKPSVASHAIPETRFALVASGVPESIPAPAPRSGAFGQTTSSPGPSDVAVAPLDACPRRSDSFRFVDSS